MMIYLLPLISPEKYLERKLSEIKRDILTELLTPPFHEVRREKQANSYDYTV